MNFSMDAGSVIPGQRVRVLLVNSVSKEREMMARFLCAWNFEPVSAVSAEDAREAGRREGVAVALIADSNGGQESISLVRELREAAPDLEAILVTQNDSPGFATEAFQAGVYDCLKRPVEFNQLSRDLNTLRDAIQRRAERKLWDRSVDGSASLESMVGFSAPMQAVFAALRRFARENSPVLITGLIGSGKEIAARTLHSLSSRAQQPLAIYRCCGVSEELAETELFGAHKPGKRTERHIANVGVMGVIESARGGTLFLDEIGDLPYPTQLRLHQVLTEMPQEPAIGAATAGASVRVLAGTRSNLSSLVAAGHFAAPLYSRLGTSVIHLPSLSERPEDIPLLCRRFIEQSNAEYKKQILGFSRAAEQVLLNYEWPGNVRELENVIGRACLLADENRIELSDLSVSRALDQRLASLWGQEWPDEAVAESVLFDSQRPNRTVSKRPFPGHRPTSRD